MSIPTLLVCDGDDAKQEILEGLVKSEPGLKYIATVSKSDGSRAVEQAIKVGTKLLWIDLDDEPVEGLNLLAETRQLYPQLPVVVSKSSLDADMVRASVNLGALDFLDPQSWGNQIKIVVAKLQAQNAPAAAAPVAPAAAPATAPAPTPNPAPAAPAASKWGDLDSIPAPGAAPAAPATPALAPAPAPAPIATASNAIARAQETTGEIHLTVTAGSRPNLAMQPQPQSAASQATTNGESGSKWGDLDSIGSPGAAAAPAPAPAPAPAAPQAAPVTPQPVPQAAPAAAAAQPPAATPDVEEAPGGKKWGDLDAIPTPKATAEIAVPTPRPIHEPGGDKWGELDAIPGPGEKRGPVANNSLVTGGGGGGKGLKRPAPEKAEMYNIPAVPIWLIILIIIAIAGAVFYMATKPH